MTLYKFMALPTVNCIILLPPKYNEPENRIRNGTVSIY